MTKKSMLNAFIPEEVLIEILARLAVKSLLRFRPICKCWYYLITNPSFITTHLNRTKSNHSHKLLIKFNYENRDRCFSFTNDETSGNEFVKLEYPFQNYDELFKIVGSCNGLLCLSDYNGSDYAVL
ncbi:putative F-box protein At3g16210 [Camellia sinensis]|uniref:putative F-box protein At3g16210 n=1 Tax=Camellia sinensis TaxID=4442 RepID=UPI0010367ABA|nr:putative F-box protein At3g16210 [Camellia sinensis]XP_028053085.1 putative F-box protein At3g16210 [Camellia sinensis]